MASTKKTNEQLTMNGYGKGLTAPAGSNPVNYSPVNYAGSGKGLNAVNGTEPVSTNPSGTTYAGSGKGLNAPAGSNPVNYSPDGSSKSSSKSSSTINVMEGVTDATRNKLSGYQNGYTPSDKVTAAEAALQNWQAQKPAGYDSKYSAQLEGILQQIANPGEFKYSFNGDNLFQSYLDSMTQKGKQASMDAMGQAAGLTGGYGSSYGQMVGNQAYQQYLTNAYDNALQYYDRAYQRYMDQQNNLYNQYNTIAGADATDYGRYRDTVGDWQNERDYLAGRYDTESDRDYGRYSDMLNYWTGLAQVENADYRSEQERQEAIRQYEQDYAERVREYNIGIEEGRADREQDKYKHDTSLNMEKYKTDTSKELSEKELAEKMREYNIGVEENQKDRDLDRYKTDESLKMDKYKTDESTKMDKYKTDTSKKLAEKELAEKKREYNIGVKEGQKDRELEKYKTDKSYEMSEKELAETIREFNEKYKYESMSEDRKYAYETVMNILAKGKMPSDKLLKDAGIDKSDAELLKEIVSSSGSSKPKTEEDKITNTNGSDKISTKEPVIKEFDPNNIGEKNITYDEVIKKTSDFAKEYATKAVKKAWDKFIGNN